MHADEEVVEREPAELALQDPPRDGLAVMDEFRARQPGPAHAVVEDVVAQNDLDRFVGLRQLHHALDRIRPGQIVGAVQLRVARIFGNVGEGLVPVLLERQHSLVRKDPNLDLPTAEPLDDLGGSVGVALFRTMWTMFG